MTVPANIIAYQVVALTTGHSISGEIILKDKRLSDHMNERVESALFLRNVTISRLDEPARVLNKLMNVVLPKSNIVLLFEPPQQAVPPSQRFYGYMETVKNDVFLVVDRMEVRGLLHTKGSMEVRRYLVNQQDAFLPITQATVSFGKEYNLVIHEDTILINRQKIRFLGQYPPEAGAAGRRTEPTQSP